MNDKITNYFIWLMMLIMLTYFAYSKGWVFSNFENISTEEAKYLIEHDKNLTLIDVRSVKKYKKDSIADSINIPFSEMQKSTDIVVKFKNSKLLIFSERGEVSIEASRLLAQKGFSVLHLQGGMVFWIRKGYEVRKH